MTRAQVSGKGSEFKAKDFKLHILSSGNHGRIQNKKENISKAVHSDTLGRKQNGLTKKQTRFEEIRPEATKHDQISSSSSNGCMHSMSKGRNHLDLHTGYRQEGVKGDSTVLNGCPKKKKKWYQ